MFEAILFLYCIVSIHLYSTAHSMSLSEVLLTIGSILRRN